MKNCLQTALRIATLSTALLTAHSWAEVVVVVSAKCSTNKLTKEQVLNIFQGTAKTFPDGSLVMTTITGSGATRDEFLSKVVERTEPQMRTIWARLTFTGAGVGPRELKDSAQTKQLVGANPGVIGIMDKTDLDHSVKVVFAP